MCAYIGTIGMAHGLEVVVKPPNSCETVAETTCSSGLWAIGAERAALEAQITERKLTNVLFTGMIAKNQVDASSRAAMPASFISVVRNSSGP